MEGFIKCALAGAVAVLEEVLWLLSFIVQAGLSASDELQAPWCLELHEDRMRVKEQIKKLLKLSE